MFRPAALLLLPLLWVIPAPAPAAAQAPVRNDRADLQLRDRIVAVVDEDPILSSDVDRAITLGFAERREGESDESFRRRVLDSLIDQRVRLHEVTRFGAEQVPVSAIEEQVEAIRERFDSEEELERRLAEVGLDRTALRQLVARQLMVWRYFQEFLGPKIFVSLDDVRTYYEESLVPELRERGAPVPPIEEVREEIRAVLQEERLNEEIVERTQELRREADIVNYFDNPRQGLPKIVLTIGGDDG